jgi:hypothetical protein
MVYFASCYNHMTREFIQCECLQKPVDIDHAAKFLSDLGIMTKGEHYSVINEWILSRASTIGEGGYTLRIGAHKGNNYAFTLCRPSSVNLLALGSPSWEKLCKTKLYLGVNHHDNAGNDNISHKSAPAASREDLIRHMYDLGETHYEANATHVVRELADVGLRDEGKGLHELPSHFTKRTLYELWVWGWGWGRRITSSNNGAYRTHLWQKNAARI